MVTCKRYLVTLALVELFLPALCLSGLRQKTDAPMKEDEEAKKLHACLQGKRIVFIGPSTSKFDYLSTAFFAEYGRWPSDAQVQNMQGLYGPNLLNEQEVGAWVTKQVALGLILPPGPGCTQSEPTWEEYYKYSNALLNGKETCDCYRYGMWKGPIDGYNTTENRVYHNGNTMLAYFNWMGDVVQPRGTFDILPTLRSPPAPVYPQCPIGQFPGGWSWGMTMENFLSLVVRTARPTHVVLSTAFWPLNNLANTAYWEGIAKAGVTSVSDTGGKIIWRNTPQRTDGVPPHHYATPRLQPQIVQSMTNQGWQFFDAAATINAFKGVAPWESVFYDNAHLQPAAQCHLAGTFLKEYVCPELMR